MLCYSVLRTIILPNNYSDLDLLLLKNEGYTEEELKFNNLLGVIEQAERRVYFKALKKRIQSIQESAGRESEDDINSMMFPNDDDKE